MWRRPTADANLQHPHILPLFDSGEADGFLYYGMTYIEGETLRDRLNRETQLGIDEAVRITTEIADALGYAHRHTIIHRRVWHSGRNGDANQCEGISRIPASWRPCQARTGTST